MAEAYLLYSVGIGLNLSFNLHDHVWSIVLFTSATIELKKKKQMYVEHFDFDYMIETHCWNGEICIIWLLLI